ncbi:MAG: ImmA/IrrE family metallo-endopeptidase [Fibrobacter sp.]|uniref:XRE family transcriptional regulator n=1 Tax=Fibrobacter sp. TaxID=35828 RepID=UPI0025C217EC|nr:ImmA/IrrE family metallo-endopeptidase [Fibrobacter sp.]MBQ7079381.1 ImmA/IrrE family metallo-endopeptidase [Fibrobacter sp.]
MNEKKIELWHVPSPGMELAEKLEEMGLDANDLAARMGYTPKAVNDILQANCRITPDSAIALEMVTEIPAIYWLRRQMSYDEFISRERIKASLSDQSLWKKSFPSEVVVREWVRYDKGDEKSLIPLLKFFAVASPQAWDRYYKDARLKVAFRISLAEVKDPYAASAWIRRGEILADRDPMEKQEQIPVRKCLKAALPEIIAFAAANKALPKRAKNITYTTPEADVVDDCMTGLQEICRKIGIRVLFVQNFKSAPIHGMYRWYKDVPLIQLHDRFEKRATMWFTFFHELAHVLYHGKKGICLQNIEITHNHPEKEDEANCFAQKCMLEAGFEV